MPQSSSVRTPLQPLLTKTTYAKDKIKINVPSSSSASSLQKLTGNLGLEQQFLLQKPAKQFSA
jgi:hypothetical protein